MEDLNRKRLFVLDGEEAGGVEDGVAGHGLVALEAYTLNDRCLTGDGDGGVGEDTLLGLHPDELFGFKLFALFVEGDDLSGENPFFFLVEVLGIIGAQGSLHRQLFVKLLEVNTLCKLPIGGLCFVENLPLWRGDAIAHHARIGNERRYAISSEDGGSGAVGNDLDGLPMGRRAPHKQSRCCTKEYGTCYVYTFNGQHGKWFFR